MCISVYKLKQKNTHKYYFSLKIKPINTIYNQYKLWNTIKKCLNSFAGKD